MKNIYLCAFTLAITAAFFLAPTPVIAQESGMFERGDNAYGADASDSKIRVGVALTAYSANGFYDSDGDKQDYSNGFKLTGKQVRVKGSYKFGEYELGGDSVSAAGFLSANYKNRKWSGDNEFSNSSGSALTNITAGVTLNGWNVVDKLTLGGRLAYIQNTEGDPDSGDQEASDGQSGVQGVINFKYPIGEKGKVHARSDYIVRFDGDDDGFSYNEGNLCLFLLGYAHEALIGGNRALFGVNVIASARGDQQFEGNTDSDSGGTRQAIDPFFAYFVNGTMFKLDGGRDTYGRPEGCFSFRGKRDFAIKGVTLSASRRF